MLYTSGNSAPWLMYIMQPWAGCHGHIHDCIILERISRLTDGIKNRGTNVFSTAGLASNWHIQYTDNRSIYNFFFLPCCVCAVPPYPTLIYDMWLDNWCIMWEGFSQMARSGGTQPKNPLKKNCPDMDWNSLQVSHPHSQSFCIAGHDWLDLVPS